MAGKKKFLILGVALVITVGGGYAAVRAMLPAASEEQPEVTEPDIGEIYKVEGVMVNPAGTKGARFLRVSAALEAASPEVQEELEQREIQIRDIMLTELGSNSIGQLMDPQIKEEIRHKIVDRINELLTLGDLTNLYYVEYIIQ